MKNHRVFIVVQSDHPGLAITRRATEPRSCRTNSNTLRQKLPSAVVAEINRLDLYFGGEVPQLLFGFNAPVGHIRTKLRGNSGDQTDAFLRGKGLRFADAVPAVFFNRAPVPMKSLGRTLRYAKEAAATNPDK